MAERDGYGNLLTCWACGRGGVMMFRAPHPDGEGEHTMDRARAIKMAEFIQAKRDRDVR